MHKLNLHNTICMNNRPFAYFRFDSKINRFNPFYTSYFPFYKYNCARSSMYDGKNKEFKNDLLIIRYLNLVNNQMIILYQKENSQIVTTLKS